MDRGVQVVRILLLQYLSGWAPGSRERQLCLRDKERDAEKGLAQTVGFWDFSWDCTASAPRLQAGYGIGSQMDCVPYMGIAGIMDKIVDLVHNLRTNGPSAFFHRPPPLTPFL